MIELNAIQRQAAHHIQRGDAMTMDPKVMLGIANSLHIALNALKRIEALPRETEACSLAREALEFLGETGVSRRVRRSTMTFSVTHKGHELSQAHLDIFVQVFNDQMDGRVRRGKKALEAECERRWAEAGIPIVDQPEAGDAKGD